MRDEAGEGADFSEHSDLVDLLYDGIQHLAFEWSEHDGFVFDWVHDESLSSLNDSRSNVIDGSHSNHEAIFSSTSSLNLRVKLLSHSVEQLWSEVTRM